MHSTVGYSLVDQTGKPYSHQHHQEPNKQRSLPQTCFLTYGQNPNALLGICSQPAGLCPLPLSYPRHLPGMTSWVLTMARLLASAKDTLRQ